MVGLMPGGSAGTSFCSGTEMSTSFRAMAFLQYRSCFRAGIRSSYRLNAGFGDDVPPFRYFVFDALAHAIGAVGDHLKAIVAQLRRDLGALEDLDRLCCKQVNCRGWRFGRREETLERVGDEVLVAEFDHGRHVLQVEPAMGAGDRKRLQCA